MLQYLKQWMSQQIYLKVRECNYQRNKKETSQVLVIMLNIEVHNSTIRKKPEQV